MAPNVPLDFNWRAYLLYHADLRMAGVRTAEGAWAYHQVKHVTWSTGDMEFVTN
jgi:hypothetical protein